MSFAGITAGMQELNVNRALLGSHSPTRGPRCKGTFRTTTGECGLHKAHSRIEPTGMAVTRYPLLALGSSMLLGEEQKVGAARATSDCHRVAQSHLPPSGC